MIQDQPPPQPSVGPSAHELVRQDLLDRKSLGFERYGQMLRPDNGRDNLIDAYQEALDLVCYLRNEIEQRRTARDGHIVKLLERMEHTAEELDEPRIAAFVRGFLLPYRPLPPRLKENQE